MSYAAWRITYQNSEAAAQAAYYEAEALRDELAALKQRYTSHDTVKAASCAFVKSYFSASIKEPDRRTQDAIKAALVVAAAS